MAADFFQVQPGQEQYSIIGSNKRKIVILQLQPQLNPIDFQSKIEVKDFFTSSLEDSEIKNYIEYLQKISDGNKIDNFSSQFAPSLSKTMTQSPSQPPVEPTTKIRNIDLITIIGSIIIPLITLAITLYVRLDTKIDNVDSKIDNGNQEIRSLIISSIRDYNRRIDDTNSRIDQVYQAPSIKSS